MTPWTYVGFAAFPNIDNKQTLKETGLDIKEDEFKVTYFNYLNIFALHFYKMILTKNEIVDPEPKVWNKIFGKSIYSPANGDFFNKSFKHKHLIITDDSYERLIALFVGSYFVNTLDEVIPRVTDEDLLNTRDKLGEYVVN